MTEGFVHLECSLSSLQQRLLSWVHSPFFSHSPTCVAQPWLQLFFLAIWWSAAAVLILYVAEWSLKSLRCCKLFVLQRGSVVLSPKVGTFNQTWSLILSLHFLCLPSSVWQVHVCIIWFFMSYEKHVPASDKKKNRKMSSYVVLNIIFTLLYFCITKFVFTSCHSY